MRVTTPLMQFAAMLGARGAAAILGLLMAFLVAPATFGLYGRVQAVALVYLIAAFLRLERAVISAPDSREAIKITIASVFIAPLTALAGVLVCYLAIPDLGSIAHDFTIFVLIYASFVVKAYVVLFTSWIQRHERLMALTLATMIQALVQFVTQYLLLATLSDQMHALVGGEIVGCLAFLLLALPKRVVLLLQSENAGGLVQAGYRWRALPLFNLPGMFAAHALVSLPLLTVGRLSDPATTGHIALAMRIADAPIQHLAGAATIFAVSTGLWRRPPRPRTTLTHTALFVAGIVAMATLVVVLGELAAAYLGVARWNEAVGFLPLATALAVSIALGMPHSDLTTLSGAERRTFSIHLAAFLAGLTVWWLSSEAMTALALFVAILAARSVALWVLLTIVRRENRLQAETPEATG